MAFVCVCVCVCVRVCVRACVRACIHMCMYYVRACKSICGVGLFRQVYNISVLLTAYTQKSALKPDNGCLCVR